MQIETCSFADSRIVNPFHFRIAYEALHEQSPVGFRLQFQARATFAFQDDSTISSIPENRLLVVLVACEILYYYQPYLEWEALALPIIGTLLY